MNEESKNVVAQTTFGGSAEAARNGYAIKATIAQPIPDAVAAALMSEGLTSLLYRGGASVLLNDKGINPKEGKSSELEYKPETAQKIGALLTVWFGEGAKNKRGKDAKLPEGVEVEVVVSEYEVGGTSTVKYRDERAMLDELVKRGTTAEGGTVLEAWLNAKLPQVTARKETVEGVEVWSEALLVALKEWKTAAQKRLLEM